MDGETDAAANALAQAKAWPQRKFLRAPAAGLTLDGRSPWGTLRICASNPASLRIRRVRPRSRLHPTIRNAASIWPHWWRRALLAVFGTAAFTVGTAPADNVITFGSVRCPLRRQRQRPVPSASGRFQQRFLRGQSAVSFASKTPAASPYTRVSPDGKTADAGNVVRLNLNDSADAPWVDGGDGW